MPVKCVGCYHLTRQEIKLSGKDLIVYDCEFLFPYACTLGGLIRPGKGTSKAAEHCGIRLDVECIVCGQKPDMQYGYPPFVWICEKHDQAWGKWLDEHPERRKHLKPRARVIKRNWIEVFREFIESTRPQATNNGKIPIRKRAVDEPLHVRVEDDKAGQQ